MDHAVCVCVCVCVCMCVCLSESGLLKVKNEFSSWKEMEVGGLWGRTPLPMAVRKILHCSWLINASGICTYLLMKRLFISRIASRSHHTHSLTGAAERHRSTPKPRSCSGLISNTVIFLGAQIQQRCMVAWQFVMVNFQWQLDWT
jgi:hypothetical protein